MMQMEKYNIYAGLGGSFGGSKFIDTFDCANEDEAEQIAYEAAVELYEQFEGYNGLPDFNDCLEKAADLPDIFNMTREQYAEYLYNSYKADWIEYYAVLTEEDDEEEEVEGDDDGNEIDWIEYYTVLTEEDDEEEEVEGDDDGNEIEEF